MAAYALSYHSPGSKASGGASVWGLQWLSRVRGFVIGKKAGGAMKGRSVWTDIRRYV